MAKKTAERSRLQARDLVTSNLSSRQMRQVAQEMQRWAACYAITELAVDKFLDRVDVIKAEARAQAVRERRKKQR